LKSPAAIIATVVTAVLLYGVSTAAPTPRAYLPSVRNGQAQAQPRGAYDLRAPAGIECFGHDVTRLVAHDGAVVWNCQAKNGRGNVVMRTDATGTRLILESGMGGLGHLDIDPDGHAYLTVGSFDVQPPFVRVLPIPGWVAP